MVYSFIREMCSFPLMWLTELFLQSALSCLACTTLRGRWLEYVCWTCVLSIGWLFTSLGFPSVLPLLITLSSLAHPPTKERTESVVCYLLTRVYDRDPAAWPIFILSISRTIHVEEISKWCSKNAECFSKLRLFRYLYTLNPSRRYLSGPGLSAFAQVGEALSWQLWRLGWGPVPPALGVNHVYLSRQWMKTCPWYQQALGWLNSISFWSSAYGCLYIKHQFCSRCYNQF